MCAIQSVHIEGLEVCAIQGVHIEGFHYTISSSIMNPRLHSRQRVFHSVGVIQQFEDGVGALLVANLQLGEFVLAAPLDELCSKRQSSTRN